MKEQIRRISLSMFDGEKVRKTDLSEYRFSLIGLAEYRAMGGQGDVEHRWVYLCKNAEGTPVLITESYGISWWDGPDPHNISRDRLYMLTEEPLTQAEFERCREAVRPMDAGTVCLPITLCLPELPLPAPEQRLGEGKITAAARSLHAGHRKGG